MAVNQFLLFAGIDFAKDVLIPLCKNRINVLFVEIVLVEIAMLLLSKLYCKVHSNITLSASIIRVFGFISLICFV